MAEGIERIRFQLTVRHFPELVGQPLSIVKAESVKRAHEDSLGELGKREHFYAILGRTRLAAAKLLVLGKMYFFLGDDTNDEMYPHFHVDLDSFKGKKRKRIWGHTHGRHQGLEKDDFVAFVKRKEPKKFLLPFSDIQAEDSVLLS